MLYLKAESDSHTLCTGLKDNVGFFVESLDKTLFQSSHGNSSHNASSQ